MEKELSKMDKIIADIQAQRIEQQPIINSDDIAPGLSRAAFERLAIESATNNAS